MTDDRTPAVSEDASKFSEAEVDEWFESEDEASVETAPENVDIVKRYSDAQLRIVRSNLDMSLHHLKHSLADPNYINMSPAYQRRHRWDSKKRSQLIESLLLNIPIPPIFLFENDYNQYEVMDGRQRLEAIRDFLENKYALRGLDYWPELDRSRFLDLPPTIQRGLLRRTVSAIVLLAETSRPEDSEIDVRMALFKRLNTGGVRLNHQELRNALYPSRFNEMLSRVARWDLFRDTWGIPRYTQEEDKVVPPQVQNNPLYKTMADCELVLRFFAIKETVLEDRKGSLRKLMDQSMAKHAADDEALVAELEEEYRASLNALSEVFKESLFVLPRTNRPSRPAYDALMVAGAIVGFENLAERAPRIRNAFAKAAADAKEYEVLVGRGNTVETIKDRVILAKAILRS